MRRLLSRIPADSESQSCSHPIPAFARHPCPASPARPRAHTLRACALLWLEAQRVASCRCVMPADAALARAETCELRA
ncbi:hypothetical protein C8T65DRAFT_282563 [Cerioporus squamosus]|nr:hypothetical protein C8T65DRAFT_282563 [Cerioporus squamosus]